MSLFTPVSVTQSLCFLLFAEDTDSCFLHLHLYSYIPEAQITGRRFREGAALALGVDTAFVPRSLLVHHRALAQSLALRFLLGFFLSGSIPLSPQTLFFLHFFPNFHFCFKLNPLMSAASFFSASSFLPLDHVSHSFLFFPVTLHPPPFYLHPLSCRFPPIITDFTSFATSSPSLPSPCYTALPQLNRWKTQLSSVLSHPCFLLAFYKTPGHRKAAIYHGRGATPRDTKAFEAVINLKHVGGMFQSVEERVRKHSAPCSPWQDCRWHTEPGSDPGLISGMWFLPKA